MALLHQATITPTKDHIVGPWLETQPWWDGVAERGPVGTFRFDDPAGEVGMECFLFGSPSDSTLFVPVTYRGAPLVGAEAQLLGIMEHSVLGNRWVYDGCGDPVFVATLVEVIRSAGTNAELEVQMSNGSVQSREPTSRVRGSGAEEIAVPSPDDLPTTRDDESTTVITAGGLTVAIARRVGAELPDGPTLTATFEGGDGLVLATVVQESTNKTVTNGAGQR